MKKILINSPRRSGSTFLSNLIRNCLPGKSSLYTEKIDQGYTFAAKIDMWKTSHENQIQVTTVREPYEAVVSLLESDLASQRKRELTVLETNDIAFIKKANVTIKALEKYYLAIYANSDNSHIAIDFNRIKDEDGPRAIINKIFEYANIPEIDDDFWELAYATCLVDTSTTGSYIRHMPNGNDETYQVVRDRLEILKDSISFDLLNTAYALAITKCIEV